jgi:hypothetical protein
VKVGQFSTPIAKLQGAMENLERAWMETRQHWEDATGDNLQQAHLEPLLKELKEIIEATVPLSEGMTQMQRACGPQRQSEGF